MNTSFWPIYLFMWEFIMRCFTPRFPAFCVFLSILECTLSVRFFTEGPTVLKRLEVFFFAHRDNETSRNFSAKMFEFSASEAKSLFCS